MIRLVTSGQTPSSNGVINGSQLLSSSEKSGLIGHQQNSLPGRNDAANGEVKADAVIEAATGHIHRSRRNVHQLDELELLLLSVSFLSQNPSSCSLWYLIACWLNKIM